MKTETIKTYWKEDSIYEYKINNELKMKIAISQNHYKIPLDSLISIANRNNPNRSFLFVSKVLGKHIPIDPWCGLIVGRIMAAKFMEDIYNVKNESIIKELVNSFVNQHNCKEIYGKVSKFPYKLSEPTIFIGFAETATGLAQAIFSSFEGEGYYTHTTREIITNTEQNISFKEDHSHAKDHMCYGLNNYFIDIQDDNNRVQDNNIDKQDNSSPAIQGGKAVKNLETLNNVILDIMEKNTSVAGIHPLQVSMVLIDDELTTGNTILNIVKELHNKYFIKEYIVLSILDWRGNSHIEKFKQIESELKISIKVVSLISGSIKLKENNHKVSIKTNEDITLSLENAGEEILSLDNKEEIALHLENRKEGDSSLEGSNIKIQYLNLNDYFDIPYQYISSNRDGRENVKSYLKETGRFGLSFEQQEKLNNVAEKIGRFLHSKRTSKNTLCLGTEEFIYIPMLISAHMGEGIKYHSTTRSPIYPSNEDGYGIKNGFSFDSPGGVGVLNYIYNLPRGSYDDLFIFFENETPSDRLNPLIQVLKGLGIPNIFIIFCSRLQERHLIGSYKEEDVIFLLKDIGNVIEETATEDREEAIQSGVHYSEMLPLEYRPTQEYVNLFHKSLEEYANKLALAVAIVSEKIIEKRGKNIVLASLARAGTPIGILIKRYLSIKYNINVPHYGISIIRGKGIDVNAVKYIFKNHPGKEIQFVDGWTGKGAIAHVLIKACKDLKNELGVDLNPDLAVLADPAYCSATFGTREDFLIPSACLNATVSGLVSRTVHRDDLIGPNDFHGAKFYREMEDEDVSNLFIDRITEEFALIVDKLQKELEAHKAISHEITWKGLDDIKIIQEAFGIEDINLIKPGIGETTRVLLRRVPWKILIKDYESDNLKHILLLARDRGVGVEEYPHMTYECCGLIKPLK